MLLIDRVLEAAARVSRRRAPNHPGEADIQGRLLDASVYDLTSVVPLFDDWGRDRGKPIPKRAPAPLTWCEWDYGEPADPGTEPLRWRLGALISEHSPAGFFGAIGETRLRPIAPETGVLKWRDRLAPDDLVYAVAAFNCLVSGSCGGIPHGVPNVGLPNNVFAFRASGEYVGASMLFPDVKDCGLSPEEERERFTRESSVFDLNVVASVMREAHDPMQSYWPPFMAFALLHCKNVAADTHTPDERTRRRVRRAGNPPRVSWKTISIRVPETHKQRGPAGEADPEARVRFHLCRGHFKNLKHPRFLNPGLHWWPAHWRGDPDAGVVVTDHRLVPVPPEADHEPAR